MQPYHSLTTYLWLFSTTYLSKGIRQALNSVRMTWRPPNYILITSILQSMPSLTRAWLIPPSPNWQLLHKVILHFLPKLDQEMLVLSLYGQNNSPLESMYPLLWCPSTTNYFVLSHGIVCTITTIEKYMTNKLEKGKLNPPFSRFAKLHSIPSWFKLNAYYLAYIGKYCTYIILRALKTNVLK